MTGRPARPPSTYRLQLGERLTFEDAREALPYLDSLRVGALYLSPILASAGGDGYHVTDPTTIDPALGGGEGFELLADEARGRGMGIIVDIVPNHMKASEENPWWADVLRRGQGSPYASYFDVDWERHGGKVLVPVLPDRGAREEGEHAVRVYWRDGLRELNYRRFFDIADLVCLRQEDPEVFRATHETILRLVEEGRVTGLRVDHVDGLRDPLGYLRRLRDVTPDALLLVEKILAPGERLPESWPVDGTTGYEAGVAIIGVLTDPTGAAACDRILRRQAGIGSFPHVAIEAKREVLVELFAGEVDRLAQAFRPLVPQDVPRADLRGALVEITATLRVYRTYVRDASGPGSEDRARIEAALADASETATPEALDAVGEVLLDPGREGLDAVLDWQQLSGPAMAKGHEDTALYRHTALVSRNEVGGDPGAPLPTAAGFHALMEERGGGSLTATSTHDSKRGEDVRARIAALSEMPEAWEGAVNSWSALSPERDAAPHEDLLLFQTLLGAWPPQPDESFVDRIQETMVKSAREAKLATSWLEPNEAYEGALRDRVSRLLNHPRFLETFFPLEERVEILGAVNGLAQVVLRAAVPGIPDLYQGAERWHLRLVDPDNRAPVDLGLLASELEELDGRADELPELVGDLLTSWSDGRAKLLVTAAALRLRASERALFEEGDYVPLRAEGAHADRVISFARRRAQRWALAVVPRVSSSVAAGGWPLGEAWGATRIRLPETAPRAWSDAITSRTVEARSAGLPLSSVLSLLPVSLLVAIEEG